MKEMDNVEVIVEKKEYAKYGVHIGRQARIIRTRFLSADFSHCRVKILVNPLGLTAFCALLCKKSAPQKICDPKRAQFSCGFLCGGCDKAFAL